MIELQYDALNRSFTAVDDGALEHFEDGELYVVTISPTGLESDMELFDLRNSRIAHA